MGNWEYWVSRGKRDREREKGNLFRKTRAKGIFADTDNSPFSTEEEEREAGEAYLEGYES